MSRGRMLELGAPPTCYRPWDRRSSLSRRLHTVCAMDRTQLCVPVLVFLFCSVVSGLKIQNKLLGKCLQVQDGTLGGHVSLGDCSPYASTQEWRWLPENQALSSQHTGECLTAPAEQYEGIQMKPCIFRSPSGESAPGLAALDLDREASSQAWTCSKKGHLTLIENGLHLSATQESTLVSLSKEHKQGSRWRALDSQTLCNKHHQNQPENHMGRSLDPAVSRTHTFVVDEQREQFEGITDAEVMETYPGNESISILSTKSPADPTMIFFSMDYGMAWKITMLVLTSLALVLGTVILVLNVYTNRRKKVVCVLKSYMPRQEVSVPGSPMPCERAPLTEHAMHLPHSTPTLQRGEILIEWKDGTVTPLYEA